MSSSLRVQRNEDEKENETRAKTKTRQERRRRLRRDNEELDTKLKRERDETTRRREDLTTKLESDASYWTIDFSLRDSTSSMKRSYRCRSAFLKRTRWDALLKRIECVLNATRWLDWMFHIEACWMRFELNATRWLNWMQRDESVASMCRSFVMSKIELEYYQLL